MSWKKSTFILAVSLLLVLGLSLSAAADVLTVGGVGPYTGPAARTGEEFQGAVEMAFEEIDYQIGDYEINLVWVDSESDPERAVRAYEDAIMRDGMQVGILNWHSSVAVALMDAAARNQIPHFFGFGATEVIIETFEEDPDYYSYWMGKTWPIPEKLSGAYVEAIQGAVDEGLWEPRNKRVGIYGEDTDWGRSFGAGIAGDFEEAGWEVVTHEYYEAGETDLYPLLTSLRDADVSVVAGTDASAPSFSAFVTQAREVGLNSLIVADGLGWVGEWYDMTGEASNYVLDQIPEWPSEEARQWAADFEDKYGITPSTSAAGQAYDQARFFIHIAETAYDLHGELNSEVLYSVGQNLLWEGELYFDDGLIHERYMYTPETIPDPVVGEGYFIFPVLQYFDGVGQIVWPDSMKEADLEIPDYLQE